MPLGSQVESSDAFLFCLGGGVFHLRHGEEETHKETFFCRSVTNCCKVGDVGVSFVDSLSGDLRFHGVPVVSRLGLFMS